MIETKKNQIESLLRACRLVGRMNKNRPDGMKSEQLYYQMLDKYFTNVLNAKQQNGFVAAHTVFFPVEILYAMGIVPLHNEVTTWTSALLLGNQTGFFNCRSRSRPGSRNLLAPPGSGWRIFPQPAAETGRRAMVQSYLR